MSSKTPIEPVDPDKEPEFVGTRSEPVVDYCTNWRGEYVEDLEPCDAQATHTVVMYDETGYVEVSMCDSCGEPEDSNRS